MRKVMSLLSLVALACLSACATSAQPTRASTADPRTSPVPTNHPFEMKGTVRSVGGSQLLGLVNGNTVTIAREGAPDAQLHVADKTRVTLDDRPAKLSDLREGDEVRAVFDFNHDTPVAIDLVAKPKR